MADIYKIDDVLRVQLVLLPEDPHRQVLKIRDITNKMSQEEVMDFPEFPDEPVASGTKIYQFTHLRVFEICVLRG